MRVRLIGLANAKIVRYGLAAVGPISVAGAQFLLSLTLFHVVAPAQFGAFSFLLVVSQLSASVWSALFCAPMPLLLSDQDAGRREDYRRGLMAANRTFAAASVLAFMALAVMVGLSSDAIVLYAVYGAVGLLRWFARAYAYAVGKQFRTMFSDVAYSLTLFATTALIIAFDHAALNFAYGGLLASVVIALLPFGPTFLSDQFFRTPMKEIRHYRDVWKRHSSWSLTGVVTTEATVNAHVYVVTFLSGAAAFAPIAASALLMRPIGVATNALTEFERPQMARQIARGAPEAALASMGFFRIILMLVWGGALASAFLLDRFYPSILFPEQYDRAYLTIGAGLWLVVAMIRILRTPESVLLQSAGQFRPLAHASMISAGISVAAVVILLHVGGPLWSIAGVAIGEAVYAFWIWRQCSSWKKKMTKTDPVSPPPEESADDVKVTIGIKALNEESHIEASLSSALTAVRPFAGEVILADSGSTDGTLGIAGRMPVRIVQLAHSAERSCGAGAQLAFQEARGEYFYLLDGDMVLNPDFLTAAIPYLESNPQIAGVGGRVIEMNTAGEGFVIRDQATRNGRNWQPGFVDSLDCGGLYRVSALREVGYFADRNLHAFEEFELAARLQSRGWRLARMDQPAVKHYGHQIGGYSLLWRRLKSGYATGPGQVLKGAIGKPHFGRVMLKLGHVRHALAVMIWWGALLVVPLLGLSWWTTAGLLAGLVLVPLAFLTWRRRSLRLGIYSVAAWNVTAVGFILGLLKKRLAPTRPISRVVLSKADTLA